MYTTRTIVTITAPAVKADFLPFVGHFFAPKGEKMTYKKKESTMLPALLSLPALSLSKGRRAGEKAFIRGTA